MDRRRNIAGLAAVAISVAGSCDGPDTSSPPAPADLGSFAGRVTRVVDGDTFWLDSRDVSIRVWALDAPERGQPGGAEATAALTRIISGEQLTCRERDIDRYGRIVGQCFLGDGRDIASEMMAGGTATEYCRYSGGAYGTC